MSAVNEWVVREYFETLGFLVSQPRKYIASGRQRRAEEEIDLLVHNPSVTEHRVPSDMIWDSSSLKDVERAVIGVRGWHTERFYSTTLENNPEILRFAESAPLRAAEKRLGSAKIAKILCLPRLPASGALKDKTILLLRSKEIDGVISFQTMLTEIVDGVSSNLNYEKSDLLQIIRLLKSYDLLKDGQLELFERRPRRRK
jgi:hypothetical protein|tara:strand:- start:133 stop:732 length:600 start_codon:yes stop_codon:yes gene_type:complete